MDQMPSHYAKQLSEFIFTLIKENPDLNAFQINLILVGWLIDQNLTIKETE